MRKLLLALASLLLLTSPAFAVSLQWDAPTTNADGTPLTDLSFYTVYKCNNSRPTCKKGVAGTDYDQKSAPILAPTTSSDFSLVPPLDANSKSFFVTATDKTGNESVESVVICYHPGDLANLSCADTVAPSKPTGLLFLP